MWERLFTDYKKELRILMMILAVGLFCHGYTFCNKLPNYDDAVKMSNKGTILGTGR